MMLWKQTQEYNSQFWKTLKRADFSMKDQIFPMWIQFVCICFDFNQFPSISRFLLKQPNLSLILIFYFIYSFYLTEISVDTVVSLEIFHIGELHNLKNKKQKQNLLHLCFLFQVSYKIIHKLLNICKTMGLIIIIIIIQIPSIFKFSPKLVISLLMKRTHYTCTYLYVDQIVLLQLWEEMWALWFLDVQTEISKPKHDYISCTSGSGLCVAIAQSRICGRLRYYNVVFFSLHRLQSHFFFLPSWLLNTSTRGQ